VWAFCSKGVEMPYGEERPVYAQSGCKIQAGGQAMRLIDAEELLDRVFDSLDNNPHTDNRVRMNHSTEHQHFIRMIKLAPTIDLEELRPKGPCPICDAKDNGFVALNKMMRAYSGIEIAANRQGMLRVRYYGNKDNFETQDLILCNYCPNCGAKMEGGKV
jgi:hypothetical protein